VAIGREASLVGKLISRRYHVYCQPGCGIATKYTDERRYQHCRNVFRGLRLPDR